MIDATHSGSRAIDSQEVSGDLSVTKWSLWDDRLSLEYTQVYRWRVVSGFTVCSCPSTSRAPGYPIEYDAKGMHLPFQSLYGIGSSSFRVRRCQVGIDIVRCMTI